MPSIASTSACRATTRRCSSTSEGRRDASSFRRAPLLHFGLSDVAPGYDVVVIGAGAAGMSAALFAAIRGAKTLPVEKTPFVGGTSALSAGSIWIPNTRHASAVGASDSVASVERYLQQIVGNRA